MKIDRTPQKTKIKYSELLDIIQGLKTEASSYKTVGMKAEYKKLMKLRSKIFKIKQRSGLTVTIIY